jgi:hypothetical protein
MGKYWGKDTIPPVLPATNSGPMPGDFPIGSALSRAAARLLMKERRDTRKRITIISNICRPGWDDDSTKIEGWDMQPHVGPWQDCGDTLMRVVYRPNVWLKPGQAIPCCPGCGTLFKKDSEYGSYEANCMDLHDPEQVS